MKMRKHQGKSMKKHWRSKKFNENQWKSMRLMKINEIREKSMFKCPGGAMGTPGEWPTGPIAFQMPPDYAYSMRRVCVEYKKVYGSKQDLLFADPEGTVSKRPQIFASQRKPKQANASKFNQKQEIANTSKQNQTKKWEKQASSNKSK